MHARIGYLAAGALVYAAALCATAPAAWVSYALDRASGSALVLREPQGTLWSGSARLYAREPSRGLIHLGLLRWQASAAGLPRARLEAELALGAADPAARLELGFGGVTIRGLRLDLPGALAATLAPEARVLRPGGRLVVRSERLHLAGGAVHGTMEIEWREARLGPPPGLALGSHVARLRGAGDGVAIELASLEGPLRLQGTGSWRAREGLRAAGTAEPLQDPDGALAAFLRGVCAEYHAGRCTFRVAAFGQAPAGYAAAGR